MTRGEAKGGRARQRARRKARGSSRSVARASANDEAMMTRAITLARRAGEAGEVPVGAILYHTATGEVLGEGVNTRERDRDPLGHAEVAAIRAACERAGDWRLTDCTLVVTLEPCAMCAGLIVNARVGRVVFGANDPKAGAVRTLHRLADDPRLNHRAEVVGGVLEGECAALMREFFRRVRSR